MSKVEELLQEINDTLEDTANSLYPSRHRDFIGLDDVLEQLISAAREEGSQRERERIIDKAEQGKAEIGRIVEWTDFEGPVFIVPASLLAPDKENEK